MAQHPLHFLSRDDVRRALTMTEAVTAMKEAFRELSRGGALAPPRTHMEAADPKGDVLVMPAYSPRFRRIGIKAITLFEKNRERGLPFIQALVLLFDGETGLPLAVLDGGSLTAIRTGAASGAATDFLARKDAHRAAIFGAGVQGRTQLEAVCAVRPIREARVFDVSP